jgi:heat shock protein HslJ
MRQPGLTVEKAIGPQNESPPRLVLLNRAHGSNSTAAVASGHAQRRRLILGCALGCLLAGCAGQSLQSHTSSTDLENTDWSLLSLGTEPVTVADRQREPHLRLNSVGKRISGSGGCNRLTGGYAVDGDRVHFGALAVTMMACPSGMEQEQAFLKALSQAARWRVGSRQLEFLDANGKPIAQFEARNVQ